MLTPEKMFEKAKQMYQLQSKARKIKKELENTHIEADTEGVIVTINGEQIVIKVEISDEAMQNKKNLEKNLEKSFNKAVKKSQEIGAKLMKDVMGDSGFPGLN